ncbi:MAG: hypothetical protein AB7O52_09545 [Planctomycetota bacterium]
MRPDDYEPEHGEPKRVEPSTWVESRLEEALAELTRRERARPTPDPETFIRRLRDRTGTALRSRQTRFRGWRRAALIPIVGALGWLSFVATRGPTVAPSDVAVVEELDFLLGLEALPPDNVPALDVDLVETVETLELLDGIALEWLEGSS